MGRAPIFADDPLLAPVRTTNEDPLRAEFQRQAKHQALTAILLAAEKPANRKAVQIAESFGVPVQTVLRNLNIFEPQGRVRAWADTLERYPKMAEWLSDPANAQMAADDSKALSGVAGAFNYADWAKRNNVTPGSIRATPEAPKTFWQGVKGIIADVGTWGPSFRLIERDLGNALGFGLPRDPRVPQLADGKTVDDRILRDAQRAFSNAAAEHPQYDSWIAQGVYSGLSSGVQMAPGLALSVVLRNPNPALVVAGLQAGIPAYGKYRARGGTPSQALLGGIGEGGVEVATEKLPMGFLVDKFGKVGFRKFIGEYLGRELVGEEAATLAQDAIDTAIANPDKTWGQYWAERPSAALQTAVATLTMTALFGGAHAVVSRGTRDAVIGGAEGEFLDDLASASAESELRKGSPNAFAALLKTLGGDAVENVYIPGEAVAQYLQSDTEHDQSFWGAFEGQIGEAVATGGDVVIPAEQLVAHLAGTKAWEALKEDMRLSAGGMSLREAGEFEGDFSKAIEKSAGEATAALEAESKAQEPRRKVYEAYAQKLMDAGFTPDVARQYAELATARAATRAVRLGKDLTGNEADTLVLHQVLPEKLGPVVAANNLKLAIAAMRHGKERAAKRGRTLVDWIVSKGGIEDRGGDIASMGGAKLKGIARKGARKLIREHVDAGQGDMLGGRSTANSPDALFVQAIEAGFFPELKQRFEAGEKLDVRDFLAAIEQELRGGEGRRTEETQRDDLRMAAQELRQLLEQEGIDADKASESDIASFVQRYQAAASEGKGYDQVDVKSAAFKKWFGDSKVVDENGEPLVVYHGTTADFEAFDQERANPESDLGAGFYFTNEPSDVAANYAGFGPDLSQKIDLASERIADEWSREERDGRDDWNYDDPEVIAEARKRYATHEGATVPAYLAIENPVQLGGPDATFLDFEENFDEETEEYDEPTGKLLEFVEAIRELDGEFSDFDPAAVAGLVFETFQENGGADAAALIQELKTNENGLIYATDENGNLASSEIVRRAFEAIGFDGFIDYTVNEKFGSQKRVGKAMEGMNEETVHYVAFKPQQVKSAIGNRGTFDPADPRILYQSYMDRQRGRVTFANGKTVVELFENRDLSTFIHETGHIWLEELQADALSPEAPDQLKADWQAIKDWFAGQGHTIGEDGVIPVEAHEMWARGVERYTMEGKAPSSALRRAFEAFRSWLLSIYQVVQNLRSPISDEVRGVMDRLLATDEEITAAAQEQKTQALFTDAAQAGMTEAEFAAYQASTSEARNEAFDALLFRTMAAVRASRTVEYKEQEARVRAEVTESVDQRPMFKALRLLRQKGGARLDRQWLIDTYGADALDVVPQGVPPIYAERGSPADEIAEVAGFQTGDDMVRALIGLETRRKELREAGDKRTVREQTIAQETDEIMKDRYGDPLGDGSIEREARELIHNDRQGEVIASELRALSRQLPSKKPTPYQLARRWAARKVAEGTVREYTSRAAVQQFQRAARKAGAAAEQAMLKGDIEETFRQKQSQMLNNALVVEATKAADAVDAAVKRMGKFAKRRTMKAVDQDYLEQAQALLEQVDLKPRSQISIDRQGAFEEWAREQEASGHDIVVPPSFAASLGATHYSRLSVEKLLGLDETVKQIIHLGRLKQTLLDGQEQREFDAVVKEAQDAAAKLPPKPPSDLMEPGFGDRIKAGIASADAALLKMETIFDWLDGGDSTGVFNRIAFRPIADAQDRENAMLHDYYARVREAMGKLPKEVLGRWQDKVTVPEMPNRETGNPFVFSRQQLVSAALNIGNEGNIQRLIDGYGWNEEAVREALNRELTAPEWQFVQDVWDIFESLWPQISQLERRVNGVEPEKIEARPVETPYGTLRGGYYPAIYDATRDYDAEKNRARESDKFGATYTRATTRASATKERSSKVSRPLLLQIGVINRHLGEVIHDITHREAVMQADKFLSSKRVMKAVDETLGPEIRKQFQPWLKFVANSWAMERAGNEGIGKFINRARTNATVVGMAWRVSTILNQLAGYSNSFEYVGARWVTEAIAKTTANPVGSFRFVMERSGEVRNRMDTLDRDIRLTISQMAGKKTPLSDAKRFMFHGIGYADRLVVIPTWLGAYNKALASGATEQDAIYEGDKAVRKSQGAGSPKDLAAIQRGTGKWGELLRVATMFYSYMSAYYQRQRTLGRDVGTAIREGDIRATPRLIARAWWLVVVPPLLSELLSGRGPGDDDDWGWWVAKNITTNSLGPIPFIRDLARPLWDGISGGKPFDYQLSPLQRAGQSFVEVGKDIGRTAKGKETKHAVKDTLEATGYATGLVPGQLATATQFLVDVGSGTQHPKTVSDWYMGLSKGKIEETAH